MTGAFGASDADGAWLWKDAYEAAEAALVLFLQRYGRAMRRVAGAGPVGPAAMLRMLETLAALEPSQTRRSGEQIEYQQFSTPLPLAYAALQAAAIRPGDVVLEPSAGTGMLAVMAQLALGKDTDALHLNELAAVRAGLLAGLFPGSTVTRHNAESIRDRLPELSPTVVLMNPPFSASPGVQRIRHHADLHHIRSAFSMLPPGGRLVAISSAHCVPGDAAWADAFASLDPPAQVSFTAPIDGRAYARRGTSFDTRLTVLDRGGEKPVQVYAGHPVRDAGHLLQVITSTVPARRPISGTSVEPVPGADLFGQTPAPRSARAKRTRTATPQPAAPHDWGPVAELAYEAVPDGGGPAKGAQPSGPYARWRASGIHVPGAVEHPTPLVQSGAMAAVPHPMPSYRPMLPENVVAEGLLSDAQLESVILAGQAHERHLAAEYRIGAGWETLVPETVKRVDADGDDDGDAPTPEDDNQAADADEPLSDPVRFRRGWMLGDGTGCGKGRQVAAIVLDQWLRGRKRALWLSQSDKLLEDARRDWCAVGGRADDVIPLGKVRQGSGIPHAQGILFATYATLRSPARQGKPSRLDQIVAWLADGEDEDERHAFQGVIVFDEAHAMANAAGSKGSRGEVRPSQQGRAGLRLQNALPDARILYVSATGATTVPGLAYARRLGLWASGETPFETRVSFIAAMEAGGVAAMEVVARDLKALGLYQARALSYDGVEVDILEHPLTPEQRRIYDSYAGAFKIIHQNIQDALKATGIVDGESTLNKNAKSAAISAFEGAKQRFFGHLLTSMKCPSLIRAIEANLDQGRSAVVQLVSTGEALMERRIAEIPASEWDDLSIDLTPREYVLDFLEHAFPVQLQEPFEDDDGNLVSRPVFDAHNNPVLCQEALAKRDALIQKLGALPPVQSALDQIVHRFGHDAVAEITGRSRRVLRIEDARGERLALRSRPASANLAETAAFMDGQKRILVFSMAGGIGRSYHADLGCANTERRIHYLLEPGWRADQAIQGLGRTHRTHQASAPLFRPVATDVKGERRFIATIARRLDSLGAITRGQRDSQTAMGGDDTALFRASDNLESLYAKSALRQFYIALWRGHIEGWSLKDFEEATGLKLTWEGNLKEDLPPMPQFLNRLLALPIDEQNQLFGALETRIEANIEIAVEAGTFERGVETIVADSLSVASRETVFTHEGLRRRDRDRRDRAQGPAGAARRRRGDHAPCHHLRDAAAAHGQRPVEARRNGHGRARTHPRRRRRAGARAPGASRRPRDHGPGGAGRLAVARRRRGPLARPLGCRDRGAAVPPRVPLLAGRGPAPAHLGPPARREHAGPPPPRRRRRAPDRPRPRPRRSYGVPYRPRSRRRPRPHRRRGPRRDHGARRVVCARQRLEARTAPPHGRQPHRDRGARGRRHRRAQAHGLHDRDRLVAHPAVRARPRHPGAHHGPLAHRAAAGVLTVRLRRRSHRRRILPPACTRVAPPHRNKDTIDDHARASPRSRLRLRALLRPARRAAADPHRLRGDGRIHPHRARCAHAQMLRATFEALCCGHWNVAVNF